MTHVYPFKDDGSDRIRSQVFDKRSATEAPSSGGGLSDGDKGDITVGGSGTTLTIDNDAVTYAKMQNVSATSRILGRKTAAAGDTEECTLSEVLDFIGSAAQGDILYRGASAWTRLAAGTAGYLLSTNGAGANPSYIAPGTASVAAGAQIGYTRTVSSTIASITSTTIPIDDTIPQNTEGAAYATLDTTYTPLAAGSKLRVRGAFPWVAHGTATAVVIMALFRDSDANAIYTTLLTIPTANAGLPLPFDVEVPANATSATTFKVRFSVNTGTGYIMRTSASPALFSTNDAAFMEVTEIKQ